MKRLITPGPLKVGLLAVATVLGTMPRPAAAESPVKLQNFVGAIDFDAGGATPFAITGTASHLGKFTCYGEVEFVPGATAGSLVGEGVAVFTAANGDLLVGVVTWEVDAAAGGFSTARIHFSWRDSVEFNDGTVIFSTGRFAHDRPPGLVVLAIISVLIGLLLPAVQ